MEDHKSIVLKLSQQVAKFHSTSTPFRIYHGNTNSTRASARTTANSVDVSSLKHIISIDMSTRFCVCEPNVPMDDLLSATIKHDLMPPIVPEFPGITVGGAFAGTAGESSCFKYGFFDRSVTSIEVILADGEVFTASESEREDLYHGAAGTFGTLGVLTLLTIKLIPCQPYVELTYLPVKSIEDAVSTISDAMSKDRSGLQTIDFLDGIMFSPTQGCVAVGRFSSGPSSKAESSSPLKVVTFHNASDNWFYLHAQQQSSPTYQSPQTDLIPLESYIFRFDRGAFWTGKYAYKYFLTPFNRITRFLLDPFMHTRIMYHALHRSGLMDDFVIQDMAVPASRMKEFSDWLDSVEGMCKEIYPRWVCPLKAGVHVSMNPHYSSGTGPTNGKLQGSGDSDYLLNIGLWGPFPSHTTQLKINRLIESKLSSLKGMKWLYAQTFYTESEFWSIYDRKWYDELRKKYKAESLPNVYQKVGPSAESLKEKEGWTIWDVWPLRGLYGVASAIRGGDYLRKMG
jgi:Delta24-sterol reductase